MHTSRGASSALISLACTTTLLLAPLTVGPAGAADVPTCDGKAATIVVPPAEREGWPTDPVVGTPGDDVIVGTSGRDTIDGVGGNDTICGLAGNDRISGGPGDDRLFGGLDGEYSADDDYFGDWIIPGPGDDLVDLGHDPVSADIWWGDTGYWDVVSFEDATGPVRVDLAAGTASGEGNDTIVVPVATGGAAGSSYDDVLLGSEGHDFLLGGGGSDRIEGRGGDDLIYTDVNLEGIARGTGQKAQPGDDVALGGPGKDVIHSQLGADVLRGGPGRDIIGGRDGSRILGGPGPDHLSGRGDAVVKGGPGKDDIWFSITPGKPGTIKGGGGNEAVTLDINRKVAKRGAKLHIRPGTIKVNGKLRARLRGIEGVTFNAVAKLRLTYVGGPWRDLVEGYPMLSVRAFGKGGNDKLIGSNGNDLLDGGPGRDTLRGMKGKDRCLRGEVVRQCELRP